MKASWRNVFDAVPTSLVVLCNAADLEAWGIAWEKHAGQPSHDAEAARLVRRLNDEVDHNRFVYQP